jgi:crotonobetainyl-CoA:carnitine CoA-transferase CaiB-like acyl-CoA transferase
MRYGDSTVGAAAAFAAVAALMHRERTGAGQFVDVSAVEVLSSMIGDCLLEHDVTGAPLTPDGNRHADLAPHGCYPCAGGEWISIAVADDPEWRRLCDALAADDLATDRRFATRDARQRNVDALDAELGDRTRRHAAVDLADRLRAVRVGAAKSATSIDVISDEMLWERGAYRFVSDRREGQRPVLGPSWRFARNSATIENGAPDLGQHNIDIFGKDRI